MTRGMTRVGYFKVGLFTLAGAALLTVMLILIGKGILEPEGEYYETYFDQSVQGLSVGSPVLFRGVKIGDVREITLCRVRYPESEPTDYSRYVYVKVEVASPLGKRDEVQALRAEIKDAVKEGLRVRVVSQGLTGLSMLEANYFPNAEDPLPISWQPKNNYIPSVPSTMVRVEEAISSISKIAQEVERVDLQRIGKRIEEILDDIQKVSRALDVPSLGSRLDAVVVDLQAVSERIRTWVTDPRLEDLAGRADGIVGRAEGATEEIRATVSELRPRLESTLGGIEGAANRVDELLAREEIERTLEELPGAIVQLQQVLRRVQRATSGGQDDLTAILANLRDITEHLEVLSNNAQRFPSHTLFGDPPPKSKGRGE